jgi:hypothetical protein
VVDYYAVVVAEHLAEWVTGSDVHPAHRTRCTMDNAIASTISSRFGG